MSITAIKMSNTELFTGKQIHYELIDIILEFNLLYEELNSANIPPLEQSVEVDRCISATNSEIHLWDS